jgi:hypothetical protein
MLLSKSEIQKKLEEKFNDDYLDYFLTVQDWSEEDQKSFCITGGSFVRKYHDLPEKDLDVFISDANAYKELTSCFEKHYQFIQKNKSCKQFTTNSNLKIELIYRPKEIDKVIDTFDFTVVRLGAQIDSDGFKIQEYSNTALEDIHNKTVRFTGKLLFSGKNYANNTLTRFMKYKNMNFNIAHNTFEDIAEKIHKLFNESDIDGEEIGQESFYNDEGEPVKTPATTLRDMLLRNNNDEGIDF